MSDVKPTPSPRLLSIDALRGFDMFWIIGGDELVHALAKWAPSDVMDRLNEQMDHVEWEGFHFYDLIFPLFLFLVGVVLPFSIGSHQAKGESTGWVYWRILRRTVLLFFLGLVYNHFLQFDFEHQRYAGVLQRIAICYGIAALIVLHVRPRGQFIIMIVTLLGYWAILAWVPAPGGAAGDLTMEGNLAGWIDRQYLPGEIKEEYYGYGDNEGFLSTIPAVATTLLGALAGQWLRSTRPGLLKALLLAVAGGVCLGLGYAWNPWFPVIKTLWTSSYVLMAGGWSLLLLAVFYFIIDVLSFRWWAYFFVVIGANAIVIYVAPVFINFHYISNAVLGGIARHLDDLGPVILVLGVLALKWLFLLYLYRRRLFLRV
jgi:predicted acyltransferase